MYENPIVLIKDSIKTTPADVLNAVCDYIHNIVINQNQSFTHDDSIIIK